MAFFAKIGLAFSLAVSSFLGLFHHGQVATSTPAVATSAPQTNSQTSTNIGGVFSWIPLSQASKYFFTLQNGEVHFCSYFNNDGECGDQIISGADPATFQVSVYQIGTSTNFAAYAKDKNAVYHYDPIGAPPIYPVRSADPLTFKVVSTFNPPYQNATYDAIDKNHKYLFGAVICEDVTKQTCEQSGYGPSDGYWFQIVQNYKTYSNSYGYKFSYPSTWNLNSGNPVAVGISPPNNNPYEDISFFIQDVSSPLGIAIVCENPFSQKRKIASGEDITWVEQDYCILPEQRDIYGAGKSIEANINLPNGKILQVMGNSTEKPQDVTAEIWQILSTIEIK